MQSKLKITRAAKRRHKIQDIYEDRVGLDLLSLDRGLGNRHSKGEGWGWGGGRTCLPLLKLVVEFPYDPVVTTVILNVAPDIRVTWLHG